MENTAAVNDLSAIKVDPFTDNPTKRWQEMQVKQKVEKVQPLPLDTPVYHDKVRFVCMSDTHNRTKHMPIEFLPPGDVFLHAGDFTMTGLVHQVEEFNRFLGTLPYKHKIIIAGNHDITFDDEFCQRCGPQDLIARFGLNYEEAQKYLRSQHHNHVTDVLTNATCYLQDSETSVYGLQIYGSPWQPEFGDWAFNLLRGELCLQKWNNIPAGVDVLITHGPPIGHGDSCSTGQRAGCIELLSTIQRRVKPKYHVFGHIHEAYGITTDGQTTFINASTCNLRYKPLNPPIIFDLPLPDGWTKE